MIQNMMKKMNKKERENLIWLYRRLDRSLNREKPYVPGSEKWDKAYFTGFESGLDKALEYLEKAFPEIEKEVKDGLVHK